MGRLALIVLAMVAVEACSPNTAKPAIPDAMPAQHASDARTKAVDPFAFDPTLFARKRPATPDDWLSKQVEPGQTFAQYLRGIPMVGTETRKVIVFQPLGPFSATEKATLETLAEFARRFFQRPVRIEKPLPLPAKGRRDFSYGTLKFSQYLTTVILNETLRPRLPEDALCYLGITLSDLYPEEAWNYVFGQASFKQRVGVYSLVRYTARFWGKKETDDTKARFLRRAMKVLAHETGHMFSLWHCTIQECLMNGSNSLDELDDNRIHLCPECLKKLHWNLEFDVLKRYAALLDFYRQHDLLDYAAWMEQRVKNLSPAPTDK